ncbi:restriction endonuclease subunit S [Arthrobacter woluwensis]|uniref:restriction endonuclease subunit S n=1 Tax=Arthrobacter woluwensis TaxID=156980 RepID=UPI0016436D8D|nr:restriction endonuclease subunit S [Arthrobacter woluwensis]
MSTNALTGGTIARGLEGAIRASWPIKRASELFELRYGKALVESNRRPGDVPVYGTNGQTGTHDVGLFTGPGVVIGRKGAGHLGVHWAGSDFWVIDTAYSLVPSEEMDLKFAYYLVKYVGLNHLKHGTSNPSLTRDAFGAQYFPVPPIDEQFAVAKMLATFDDKIESNRKLIDLVPKVIRARIDSALIRGGDLIPVASLARFVNGGAYTKGATGNGRMVLRIAELNSGPGASTVYNEIDVPEEKTARAGDILMSWSGSLGVYRWFRDEAIVNQHIFKVIPNGHPAWLAFDRLDAVMPVFRGVAADKATTMGHIQRGHLTSTEIAVPQRSVIEELDGEMAPLWARLLLAERENLRLERLRDTLLPELLSGRTRVAEAQEAVA